MPRKRLDCLNVAVRYLEEEIAFREIRHVCSMHKGARRGREDACSLLGDAENAKLVAWEAFQKCMVK